MTKFPLQSQDSVLTGSLEPSASNGLINRRQLLSLSLKSATLAGTASMLSSAVSAQSSGLEIPAWSKTPGPGASDYGSPSSFTTAKRMSGNPNPFYPGGGASRSPLHQLQGSITPSGLHFERHHAGIPAIDPAGHKLVINGLVSRPLSFDYKDLLQYPMISRVYFLECSGNSGALFGDDAPDGSAQSIHGLVSCSEWTGIKLSSLLEEAGISSSATWVSAVGADAASMGRSLPLDKALEDVMLALFQNGEPLRPEQGYPMRLFVPGWEGNVSVKWLTQLKLTNAPSQFRDETSKYTDTLKNRKSRQFSFPMDVKSIITSPSGQMKLSRQGVYELSGIAWSGGGRISQVEVSADGGKTWALAEIDSQLGEKALARFRIPWNWSGGEALLQSRATDSNGIVQPTRGALIAAKNQINYRPFYHYNAIQSWAVNRNGEVSNVYA